MWTDAIWAGLAEGLLVAGLAEGPLVTGLAEGPLVAGLAEDLHRLCAEPVSHSDKEEPMHWCGDMGMFRITGLQIMSLNAHGQAGRQKRFITVLHKTYT